MKMLGIGNSLQSMEGFMKSRDQKYQIPKLSARSNTDTKDNAASSDSNTKSSTDFSSNDKTPVSISKLHDNQSNVHAMSLLNASKMHSGGRASSVSPKYTTSHENNPTHNKDLHFYKSTSSDGMHAHQNKHMSFSNPTTPTSTSISLSSYPSPVPYSHPSSGNNNNSGSYAPIINKSPVHSSVLPKFLSNDMNMRQMQNSMLSSNSSSTSNKTIENMLDYNVSGISASSSSAVAANKQNKTYQKKSPKLQSSFVVIPSPSDSPQYITDDEAMDESLLEFGRK